MSHVELPDEDDGFTVMRDDGARCLHVLMRHPEHGGLLGVKLIVEKVALHWRVVEFDGGPGLEGHERYLSEDTAVEAAKGLLRAGDAARRLQGGGQSTTSGRFSSNNPNLQNLPRSRK